jgi:hypothetical protein
MGPGMDTDSQAIGNGSLGSSREANDVGTDIWVKRESKIRKGKN